MRSSFAKTQANCRAHVAQYVALNYVGEDGASRKERAKKLKRNLADPKLPESMRAAMAREVQEAVETPVNSYEAWLLARFWEMDTGRRHSQVGPEPLAFSDIVSYVELYDFDLAPIEVELIKAVDVSWLEAVFAEQRKSQA